MPEKDTEHGLPRENLCPINGTASDRKSEVRIRLKKHKKANDRLFMDAAVSIHGQNIFTFSRHHPFPNRCTISTILRKL